MSFYHRKKGEKYNSKRTEMTLPNGQVQKFASKKEAFKVMELFQMQKHGYITGLELQKPFEVLINGQKIFTYRADACFTVQKLPIALGRLILDVKVGEFIIIDVKGFKTPVYNLKKKAVEAYHGIKITEV